MGQIWLTHIRLDLVWVVACCLCVGQIWPLFDKSALVWVVACCVRAVVLAHCLLYSVWYCHTCKCRKCLSVPLSRADGPPAGSVCQSSVQQKLYSSYMTSDQRILVGWSTYLHTWTYSSKHISEDNTRWLQGFGFRREAAHRGGISAHLAAGCLKLSLLSWRVGEKSSSVNTDAHIQNTSSRSSA